MRAIICDDDEIIRKGLCSVVDWESLGVEIAGTAGDGKEGLRLLREQKPDLLLSDIRMPYVDGLELIQEGRKLNPELMVIVFSGYDDFAYVRKALQLGVQDYLTKPIDMEELTRLVISCVRQFGDAVRDSFEEKENLLRKLLVYEDYEDARIREMETEACQVVILESEEAAGDMGGLAKELRRQGIYVLVQKERRFELAVVAQSGMQVQMRCSYGIETVRKRFEKDGVALVSAVSSIGTGIRSLGRCYEEAKEALKLKYVKGYNQDLSYEELKRFRGQKAEPEAGDAAMLFNTDLIDAVRRGDPDCLGACMDELEQRLEKMGLDSFLYMQFMVGNLYSSILKELDRIGICAELVFENPVDEYRKLIECETIQKALGVLRGNLSRICEYVGRQKAGAYPAPIYKALQYIGSHYNCPSLSQEEVAAEAGLSGGRFSTLFKAELGCTFTDYLLQVRMERAKELMKNPNMKIYEAAMMAGYENIPYFSTAFKKYTGMSPSEYRSSGQKTKA